MAETENIGRMAEIISDKLFGIFKWEIVKLYNTNFVCKKPSEHSKKETYTHPVDVVFHYLDPYTNKRIFFNTDLKSYKENSISMTNVRNALKSLSKTIDCARLSKEWTERYNSFSGPKEIRGMLFTYNHDGNFDKEFYKRFFTKSQSDTSAKKVINPASLKLKKGQLIHIIEPTMIAYLNTVVADLEGLISSRKFPHFDENKYWFYYPDLHLHKTHYSKYDRAASIEMLSSNFLIIGHDKILNSAAKEVNSEGFVIYYNGTGETTLEFIYLLDTLSKNQILDSGLKIRIRCTSPNKNKDIRSVFKKSINEYAAAWGFDDYKLERLKEIESEFELITQYKEILSEIDVGWRKDL